MGDRATRASARCSSRSASSSRRRGRRTRRTSSPRSTSAASSTRRRASARSSRWSRAWPGTIADWGRQRGYFASVEDGDAFEAELTYILLHQLAAFNSPVWFNVGFEENPQCSACFILSVRRHDGVDPRLEHQGGQDLPRWVRLRDQPVEHPRVERAAEQGRHRLRPGLVHARRRRLGRHDQVGRQDAPRGEDGRARRRPPGHPRVHLVQGARRRTRPPRCATPGSTCRSTATASSRSSTRTPTTRSGSPTSSCTRSRTTPTGA